MLEQYHTKLSQLCSNLRMTVGKYPSIRFRQVVFHRLGTIVSVTLCELNAFCEMLLSIGFDIFLKLMGNINCQSIFSLPHQTMHTIIFGDFM